MTPTRVVKARGVEHQHYELTAEPGDSPLENEAKCLDKVLVREKLGDPAVLQLSFELGLSPDDPGIWATLENLSMWA